MNLKTTAVLLVTLLSSSACKKEPEQISVTQPVYTKDSATLTLNWRTALNKDENSALSISPVINREGNVIFSELFSSGSGPEVIKLFDGKSGALKWEWKDYSKHEKHFTKQKHLVVNDALIISAGNATYAMNIITGETIWRHYMDTMHGSHMIFENDGYLYKGFTGATGMYNHHLFRTPYNQSKWELVCTYTDTARQFDRMNVSSVNFGHNEQGERLVIYALNCENTALPNATICCYNLSVKRFEWITDHSEIIQELSSVKSVATPHLFYQFAFGENSWLLCAFNLKDGSLEWKRKVPDQGINMFLYKHNILALYNGSNPLQCINQNSGALIWEQGFDESIAKISFAFNDANIFKNYLFSTQCDNMLILNADNGKVVFNKKAAVNGGCLQYGVAINEHERLFYVQDRTYANCFKLPDEVKF